MIMVITARLDRIGFDCTRTAFYWIADCILKKVQIVVCGPVCAFVIINKRYIRIGCIDTVIVHHQLIMYHINFNRLDIICFPTVAVSNFIRKCLLLFFLFL